MNKALEDLQAGRDPFAAREEESDGSVFFHLAFGSMFLSVLAGVLCYGGTNVLKNLSFDPKIAHTVWQAWLIGSYVLFGLSILMGLISLFGIRKHGADGILARTLTGVLISGICIALLLTGTFKGIENQQILAAVRASEDQFRTEMKNDLAGTGSVGFTNNQRQAQNLKNTLDDASQKLTGNDALLVKAASATMGKMQGVMNEYAAVATPIMQPAFISVNGVVQPEQLQRKKEMVASFMAANEKVLAFVNNADKVFTEEMNRLHVPPEMQAQALKGFRTSISAQNNALVKIREQDRVMGNALIGMFNLLDANWGRWEYNAQTRKVRFEDSAAVGKYNAFLGEIVTAGREQTELQRQYFAMQPKGG